MTHPYPELRAGGDFVDAHVQEVAATLTALFERDRGLAAALNLAQERLLTTSDLLRVDLAPEALAALLGPAGPVGALSALLDEGWSIARGWAAREAVADAIRSAFVDYQSAADKRCLLAADVGEATTRLVEAMAACGFSEAQARNADVWALRQGVYREG